MIDINITLVVQALHFLLMWWFLDRFFFRHVVKVIQKEDAQLKRLNYSITKEHEILTAEQERQKKLWQTFKKRFGKEAPDLEDSEDLSFLPITLPTLGHITKERKEELIKETKTLVIKKVLDND